MEIYNYHPGTNEYVGKSTADESPLEECVFLIPAHATSVSPPNPVDGFAHVFTGSDWLLAVDKRGDIWWDADGRAMQIDFLGDPAACGLSDVEPEPQEPEAPLEISDRQFFQQMAHDGQITEQEALDAVGSGAIPAAMEALIVQLPAEQQFPARMLVRGATTFRRDHPVTALIGNLFGMSAEQIDKLWLDAAVL